MKWERENPYLFLEDLRMKWSKNEGFSRVIRWVWERVEMGKTMNNHKSSREKLKTFKKLTYLRKTHHFRDWVKSRASRQGQSPKHSRHKFWKIFLSFFRDWKVYPWESRDVSHENLYVPLATRPSTREKVAILSPKKHKDPNFWKIF